MAASAVLRLHGVRPEADRKHAGHADLPFDEIISIADTVVVRPDPQQAAEAGQ